MEIKNITKALIQFHSEVGKVEKNSVNPYFKSKYGDLNSYLEVIKEPLKNCGLALTQLPITNGLKTLLLHESGEFLESEMTIPGLPADPQKVGAAITYMRRYMIAAILSLNAEDNDYETANNAKPAKPDYKAMVLDIYKKVKEPSDKLKEWIAGIDLHSETELQKGIVKMKELIK